MKNVWNFLNCFLVSVLIVPVTLHAGPVDMNTAAEVAKGKIASLNKAEMSFVRTDALEFTNGQNHLLFYLFRLQPTGYMVIAADDDLPPVIAYSFADDITEISVNRNPLLHLLTTDLEFRMNNIKNLASGIIQERKAEWQCLINTVKFKKSEQLFQQWPPEGTTSTGGWLETNWTQSPPYNNFCPMDPVTNQRSLAGCPATAMAQILNYYKTTNSTQFTNEDDYYHAYAGRNYWIDDDCVPVDFPCFPDLNSYLDTVAMSFENNSVLKNNEKAALTFACGVAAHQVYTSQGSGTFGVGQAEDAYLRFGFTNALLLENTDTSLFTKLSQNMMEARPAHLAVVDPGWTMGHNVVTDGYNTDNYYHLNFGWGGSYNGWYLLPDEIPYGLTVIEGVIVDIAFPPVNTGISITIPAETKERIRIYPNPAHDYLCIDGSIKATGSLKIEIYNATGSLIYSIEIDQKTDNMYPVTIDLNQFSQSLSPGLFICKMQTGNSILTEKFLIE